MFQGRELYFVCGGKCMKLPSINGEKGVSEEVEELHSNQEEADTKIVLHTLHASKHSPDDATVTVLSPDTGVFILLLYIFVKEYRRRCSLTLVMGTSGGASAQQPKTLHCSV
jgi:hypothetical protein